MTEKPLKKFKNKNQNKNLKTKVAPVKKNVAELDSDISDSEVSGKAPKIDKKALKKISSEVTDLLASLKKEHGIENESDEVVQEKPDKSAKKANKAKKNAKTVDEPNSAGGNKKAKLGQQPEKKLPVQPNKGQEKGNKKQKLVKNEANQTKEATASVAVAPQENSPAKKKKKNKKRAANEVNVNNAAKEAPATKKVKPNQNQNQKENPGKAIAKKAQSENVDSEQTEESKEHHLKDAVPVFVGNLPTNIKRLKVLKMFKKFGKVLSIRFRTNSGKSFLRKAQIAKAPFLIAFVYFDSLEAAKSSLILNGEKVGENSITVDLDLKTEEKDPQNTVVVGNLKYAVTDAVLREAFKCCGEIERIRLMQGELGCKGVAFIRFAKPESCALALKLNGTQILEREIRVEKFKLNKLSSGKKDKKQKKGKIAPKPGQKPNADKKPGKNAGKNTELKDTKKQTEQKKNKKNKEFLGLKSNDKKKVLNKKNKKKKLSGEKLLAKKVAPKPKKTAE